VNKTLLVALCVFGASVALAQQPASGNRDARRAEMQAKADARFKQSDSNHDGKLSQAEWRAAREQRLAEEFARLDANKDGGLTADEMRQGFRARQQMRASHRHAGMAMREQMRALDVDHDQALSRAEIGERMPRLSQNFDRIDSNHDGNLSREEMRAARDLLRQQAH
jgi:Ca2+-binding EF-hand superfamily protein